MNSIHPKVGAAAIAGALATLVLGLLGRYTSYTASPDEAAAITTTFMAAIAWLVPEKLWDKADGVLAEVDMVASDAHEPTDVPADQVAA